MRLLFVIHQFFPDCHSGTEQYCLAVAREGLRRGDDVTVLSLHWRHDRERPPIELFEAPYDGLRVIRLNHWRRLNPNDVLRDYENRHLDGWFQTVLDSVRPTAVHFFHLRQLGANLIAVAARNGIRTVINLMDFWYLCPRFTLLREDGALCSGPPDEGRGCVACEHPELEGVEPATSGMLLSDAPADRLRALLDRPKKQLAYLDSADVIIAPSRFLADMFARNGLPRERMTVVPYGLEPGRIQPIATVRPRQPLRLGFCGVLSPWKAPHLVVDAVRESQLDVQLTVHGRTDEPMFQEYIDRIMASAADDQRIRFAGPYAASDARLVFAEMDVLVVPSTWYENTPFVILEAFAAGVPVIASDLGGLSEAVQEGENGWLFPAGDVEGLRAAIREVAENPECFQQLSPPDPPDIGRNYDVFATAYRGPEAPSRISTGPQDDPRATREFRTGHFLWNVLPLGRVSRFVKGSYRRARDAGSRAALRWRRNGDGRPTAIVASTWAWPQPFHTFVYQEMRELQDADLDVRVFFWQSSDVRQLPPAFHSLLARRTQLQPLETIHERDRRHFERTQPDRLAEFVRLVAKETGRSVDEIASLPLLGQACTFARAAELAGADYVHSYFFYELSFMAALTAHLLRIPRGITCYADHMLEDHPFKLVRLHLELVDIVIASTRRVGRELSGIGGGRFDEKIFVKPNAVDGGSFTAPPHQRADASAPFAIVSVSRIEPKKGLLSLVSAAAELVRRGRSIVVHVVGDLDDGCEGSRDYHDRFWREVAALGLEARFVRHGVLRHDELPALLARCDAFAAPYVELPGGDKDGIPTAILEAMAMGLPIVTTDAGSIPEAIVDGKHGLIVAQHDAIGLADALEHLLGDPSLRGALGKAARQRFSDAFDARAVGAAFGDRIRRLIAGTDDRSAGSPR